MNREANDAEKHCCHSSQYSPRELPSLYTVGNIVLIISIETPGYKADIHHACLVFSVVLNSPFWIKTLKI